MKAELLSIGTELLREGRPDGNAAWLAARLEERGVACAARTAVEDDEGRIAAVLAAAMARAGLVVATGGLGPTEDDRTREALAQALGSPLVGDPAMEDALRARFAARGRPFGPGQARMALRPEGTAWIPNPVGTAPGILVRHAGGIAALLPGVPAEMRAMFTASLDPEVRRAGGGALARRTLWIAGRTESSVDEQVRGLYARPGVEATILAHERGIELVFRARGADPAEAGRRAAAAAAEAEALLGEDVFGRDGETLPAVVGGLLLRAGRTVAAAESCTAGLLLGALTEVPGSSAWVRGGCVVYADDLKSRLAGVPPGLLRAHGAVSAEVAVALAEGARDRCGADYGIGITGIAGPGGGSPDKPVGLVHLAVAGPPGPPAARRLDLPGDRAAVRARTVTLALDALRRRLLAGTA